MSKTSESEFNRVWTYLVAAFPEANELGELNFQVYYDALHDVPAEKILAGFKRYIHESGSKFFPSAPEIRLWVVPKLSNEDKAFENAIQEHKENEAKWLEAVRGCIKEMVDKGLVFCQLRINQDDPYRDTWDWVDKAKAVGKFSVGADYIQRHLERHGRLALGPGPTHHLSNSVADWDLQKQLANGGVIEGEVIG